MSIFRHSPNFIKLGYQESTQHKKTDDSFDMVLRKGVEIIYEQALVCECVTDWRYYLSLNGGAF